METMEKIHEQLRENGQEQLLQWYGELTEEQKQNYDAVFTAVT